MEKTVLAVWSASGHSGGSTADKQLTPAQLEAFFKMCGPVAAVVVLPDPRDGGGRAAVSFKEERAMRMAVMLDRGIVEYVPVRVQAFHADQQPELASALASVLTASSSDGPALKTISSSSASTPSSTGISAIKEGPKHSSEAPAVPSYSPPPVPSDNASRTSPVSLQPSAKSTSPRASPRAHEGKQDQFAVRDLSPEDHQFGAVVSNLSSTCSTSDLQEFFALCGNIEDIVIFSSIKEPRPPMGLLLFSTEFAANMALSLSGAVIAGSVVKVEKLSDEAVDKLANAYRVTKAALLKRKRDRTPSPRSQPSPRSEDDERKEKAESADVEPNETKAKRQITEEEEEEEHEIDDRDDQAPSYTDLPPLPPKSHVDLQQTHYGGVRSKGVHFDVENGILVHGDNATLFNLRDVSRVYTAQDRVLKKRRIYRSAAWMRYSGLQRDDFRPSLEFLIRELGIKTIIDLRSADEKSVDPWYDEVEIHYKSSLSVDAPPNGLPRRLHVDLVTRTLKVQLFATSKTSLKWRMLKSAFSSSGNESSSSENSRTRQRKSPSEGGKSKLFLGINLYDLQNFQIPGTKVSVNVDTAANMFISEVIRPMGLEGFTRLFVMYAKEQIGQALRICADPRNYPILIHCTSGKDRTGLIVALLLTVCGVDRLEVVENYHLSERFLGPVMHEIHEENERKCLGSAFDGTPRPLIRNILEFIDSKWGSVAAYLHNACNFTFEEQRILRRNLIRSGIINQFTPAASQPDVRSLQATPPYTPLVPMAEMTQSTPLYTTPAPGSGGSAPPPIPLRPWQSTPELRLQAYTPYSAPPPIPPRPHAQSPSPSDQTSPTNPPPLPQRPHRSPDVLPQAQTSPERPREEHEAGAGSQREKVQIAEVESDDEVDEATQTKSESGEIQSSADESEAKSDEDMDEETKLRSIRVTGLPPFMATADLAHFFVFCGRIQRLNHDRAAGDATIVYANVCGQRTALMLDGSQVAGRQVRVTPLE